MVVLHTIRTGLQVIIVAWLVPGGNVLAQGVGARAFLDRDAVGVNQQFVLSVEVTGTQQAETDPELPDMSEFSIILSSGTSTSMQIVNNRTTVSVTLQYRFQATKVGTFEIGSVVVQAAGETYRTDPLTLTVSAAPPQAPPVEGAERSDAPEIGADDLFITTEVSKRRVRENEPVVVEYRVYTRVSVTSYSVTRLPGTEGFWVEEFNRSESPQVEQVVRGGVQYATAVIRKVALFPTGPGTKTIEPMSIEAQVRVRRRSRDPFEDFFRGAPLLGGNVPVIVASEPVQIEVLPLADDTPSDFSGLVGEFTIDASVDKSQVAANEAVTLTVHVAGEGNVRMVPEPRVAFPRDFEIYPPEVTQNVEFQGGSVRGEKTFEYVLIPRTPGDAEIPPITLSYFDANLGEYAVSATQPIDVAVTGEESVTAPGIGVRSRSGVEPLREDIRFIEIGPPQLKAKGRSPFTAAFWIVLLVPLAAVGGVWGLRKHRDRLEGDVAYARQRRATRVARRRLSSARSTMTIDTPREFYTEVARALEGFLGDKLNFSEAGFIKDDSRARLLQRGVPSEIVGRYLDCLDECDRQRFAPAAVSLEGMQATLKRAEQSMADLDQELRR
jgi:hypothetical protein